MRPEDAIWVVRSDVRMVLWEASKLGLQPSETRPKIVIWTRFWDADAVLKPTPSRRATTSPIETHSSICRVSTVIMATFWHSLKLTFFLVPGKSNRFSFYILLQASKLLRTYLRGPVREWCVNLFQVYVTHRWTREAEAVSLLSTLLGRPKWRKAEAVCCWIMRVSEDL